MTHGQYGDQWLVAHRLVVKTFINRQQQGGKVHLPCFQAFAQPFTAVLRQFDVDARVTAAVSGEHRRKQDSAPYRRQADAQHAALEAAQVVDFGHQVGAFGEHHQGAAVGNFASGGEFVLVAEAIEQRHA